MPTRIIQPEWRLENRDNPYPFAERATLIGNAGEVVPDGLFLDASLYVIGAGPRLYLSTAEVSPDEITLWVGDSNDDQLASVSFDPLDPPERLDLRDAFDRPAGMLLTETVRIQTAAAWGAGTHTFSQQATEFCATCCIPTPEVGLRGFLLPDGSILTGDVWLVGEDGVVLRYEGVETIGGCGQVSQAYPAIRFEVVGDPLFRRRLCEPVSAFTSPRFVRAIHVKQSVGQNFTCVGDDLGDIQIVANNQLAIDTVLRAIPIPGGLRIEAVGRED